MTFLQLAAIQAQIDSTKTAVVDSIPILGNMSQKISSYQNMNASEILHSVLSDFVSFGLKVIAALAIYLIGAWIIKRVKRGMRKLFEKRGTEPSLAGFVTSLVNVGLIVLLIVIVIGTLGINTTSFAAILASGGLAVGMALSGTLQNFAGGIMILAFKPYKVGDYIEAQGYSGTVKSIAITSTRLLTVDNKMIVIPNGALSNSSINNYSSMDKRRVDWSVSISYGDDFDVAKKVIIDMLSKDKRILKKPAVPLIVLGEMADSSIVIYVRAWVKSSDYWDVFFEYNEQFYKELPQHGLNFPFPHITLDIPSKASAQSDK